MRKCPRCNHDIQEDAKYCPYCGLDVQRKYKPIKKTNKWITRLLYIALLFSFIAVPILYSRLLTGMSQDLSVIEKKQTDLPDLTGRSATAIIGEYDTLADFNQKYTNVSTYVDNIEKYSTELEKRGNYTFEKEYLIQVLDNYNVCYRVTYTAQVSKNNQLVIIKEYDRAHTYNKETITFVKKNAHNFNQLILTDQEKVTLLSYMDDEEAINKVIKKFSSREAEFEKKKEKIGHYGMGTYLDNISFVVNRYGKTYQSTLQYNKECQEYIG